VRLSEIEENKMPLSFLRSQVAANLIGMLGSICFTIQYVDICLHTGNIFSTDVTFSFIFCVLFFLKPHVTHRYIFRYIPQAQLNYQRKSVKGFNKTGIIIKLIGACFLTVNAFLSGGKYFVIPHTTRNCT